MQIVYQRILLCVFLCFFGFTGLAFAPTDSLAVNNETLAANDTLVHKTETTLEQLDAPSLSDVVSGTKIAWTIVFLIFGYIGIRISVALLNAYAKRNPKQSLLLKRVIPIFRIFAWMFLIYVIVVGIYAPPASTLIAFLASIGVAVGFAAQDLVKNIFGGLVVMFDRPFQIGDKIDAGGQYGEVIEIGIRSTKIVTPDDSVVTIPNSDFMSSIVSNSNSGESNCQVVAEIYLPLNIDTEKVRKMATEAALISKYIFLNKPITVLFFNEIHFNQPVYKMRLKAYVSDLSKEFVFKSEMTEIVVKTLLDEGILPISGSTNSS
ncbi:MAG: mechanosensitive ion channel [Bacteroidales bacterium]|nr:mechanosensitive ion channel [Bacteroidales bacterium]